MQQSRIDATDAIVLFADLQFGIADLPLTVSPEKLRKGVLALAKLAKLFDIPAIAAVVAGDGTGKLIPEVEQGYGPIEVFTRTTADSFKNDAIVEKLASFGRKTLLICGVATELAVSLPAMSGVDAGYRTYVVLDACGGISERTEQAALRRIEAAGGLVTSAFTLAGELAGDFREEKGQHAREIIFGLV
jgi:nicotinamidase-related amidase